jgi:hypothetical protein
MSGFVREADGLRIAQRFIAGTEAEDLLLVREADE